MHNNSGYTTLTDMHLTTWTNKNIHCIVVGMPSWVADSCSGENNIQLTLALKTQKAAKKLNFLNGNLSLVVAWRNTAMNMADIYYKLLYTWIYWLWSERTISLDYARKVFYRWDVAVDSFVGKFQIRTWATFCRTAVMPFSWPQC